jgi:hypothetical protein
VSGTPILDAMKGFQRDVRNNAVLQIKVELLNWLEAEITSGKVKRSIPVDKVIKKVNELK